jgi:ribosomal protein S27AE
MPSLGVRIWSKTCPKCGGDLRYEHDSLWKAFICYQCGWAKDLLAPNTPEEIVYPQRANNKSYRGA